MFFFPVGLLFFLLFILSLPVLFFLGYFHILTIGFGKLGISVETSIFILLLILVGSAVNIPLTKRRMVHFEEPHFFGFLKRPKIEFQGIAVNLGGALIPAFLSLYFLYVSWQAGFSLQPILITTILIIIISNFLAKVVPGKGISLPAFIPPVFSAIFALIFAPKFAAICAFISGVLGVLIGADLLNLRKAQKFGGFISIGGAGVFDGIFLVGIISALLAGF